MNPDATLNLQRLLAACGSGDGGCGSSGVPRRRPRGGRPPRADGDQAAGVRESRAAAKLAEVAAPMSGAADLPVSIGHITVTARRRAASAISSSSPTTRPTSPTSPAACRRCRPRRRATSRSTRKVEHIGAGRDARHGQSVRARAHARSHRQGARHRPAAAHALLGQVRGLRHREGQALVRRPLQDRQPQAHGRQQARARPADVRRRASTARPRPSCRCCSPWRCSRIATASSTSTCRSRARSTTPSSPSAGVIVQVIVNLITKVVDRAVRDARRARRAAASSSPSSSSRRAAPTLAPAGEAKLAIARQGARRPPAAEARRDRPRDSRRRPRRPEARAARSRAARAEAEGAGGAGRASGVVDDADDRRHRVSEATDRRLRRREAPRQADERSSASPRRFRPPRWRSLLLASYAVDDEALRALANRRAQTVKAWFTDQGGIAVGADVRHRVEARRRRRQGQRRADARRFRAEVNCVAPHRPAYRGKRMAAYVVANIEVTDAALYDEYRKGVGATIAAHGGRFLARGGASAALEGTLRAEARRDPRVSVGGGGEGVVRVRRVQAADRAAAAGVARRSLHRRRRLMPAPDDDDAPRGRVWSRREAIARLGALGAARGVAVRRRRAVPRPAAASPRRSRPKARSFSTRGSIARICASTRPAPRRAPACRSRSSSASAARTQAAARRSPARSSISGSATPRASIPARRAPSASCAATR